MRVTIDLSHSRAWEPATLAHLGAVIGELHDGDPVLDVIDGPWAPGASGVAARQVADQLLVLRGRGERILGKYVEERLGLVLQA